MKLKNLIKDLPLQVKGSKEVEITGLTENSKSVAPGFLFFAKKGQFIPEAIRGGAVAIVTDLYDPFLEGVVQIISPDIDSLEPLFAQIFYGSPEQELFLAGVTGTNGKTTTSYLIKYLLEPCGLIGTIEWVAGNKVFPSTYTTPDLLTNYKLLHEMAVQKCTSAVMEVSSHGLVQGRVRTLPFDAAVFTNLTQDHLDYHQIMEEYAAAKAKLFSSLSTEAVAIYNLDSPWAPIILEGCKAQKFSYGLTPKADLYAQNIELSSKGTQFTLHYQGQTLPFSTHLIGRFNVYNLLAAISVGLQKKSLPKVLLSLQSFAAVPGRLERVSNRKGLHIFVDYAHTDDALKNVLETLTEFKEGRLITVFGCGGNRDRTKRPKMAGVAEALSDFVIVTTDNPRQEDPQEIVREIASGFKDKGRFTIELDRSEAIGKAIGMATSRDIVLIAGKGHERTQVFSEKTIEFDDRLIARQACDS